CGFAALAPNATSIPTVSAKTVVNSPERLMTPSMANRCRTLWMTHRRLPNLLARFQGGGGSEVRGIGLRWSVFLCGRRRFYIDFLGQRYPPKIRLSSVIQKPRLTNISLQLRLRRPPPQ